MNTSFCTIFKDCKRLGFGALVDIKDQKENFRTTCACIVPDNVIKINAFLCSKEQKQKFAGKISIQKKDNKIGEKSFDIVELLYYDTRLGICCYKIRYKSDAKIEKIQ